MKEIKRTVLHVDDDPQVLRIIGQQLEKQGFSVISIDDPNEAIQTLIQHEIRVAILDIDMPHKNGIELLTDIKEYDGGVQVIMLSGVSTVSSVLKSLRLGAEACFFKPVTEIHQIVEALEATFTKINRWWETLYDLSSRKKIEQGTAK